MRRYSCSDSSSRRKNATRETTSTLKAWLQEHQKNPYPTKGEKIMLAIITRMTLTQVGLISEVVVWWWLKAFLTPPLPTGVHMVRKRSQEVEKGKQGDLVATSV